MSHKGESHFLDTGASLLQPRARSPVVRAHSLATWETELWNGVKGIYCEERRHTAVTAAKCIPHGEQEPSRKVAQDRASTGLCYCKIKVGRRVGT